MNNTDATPTKKDWRTPFLTKLAETGNVAKACRAAKINRTTAYRARWDNAEFAQAWDEALQVAVSLLEDEAWRRAHQGWLEPVFYKGEKTGSVRKYSDTLLIFLLKAHNPARYRENIAVTGAGGGPLEVKDVSAIPGVTPAMAAVAMAAMQAALTYQQQDSGDDDSSSDPSLDAPGE